MERLSRRPRAVEVERDRRARCSFVGEWERDRRLRRSFVGEVERDRRVRLCCFSSERERRRDDERRRERLGERRNRLGARPIGLDVRRQPPRGAPCWISLITRKSSVVGRSSAISHRVPGFLTPNTTKHISVMREEITSQRGRGGPK